MEAQLWFDRFAWLVFLMPFLGLAVAGLSRRTDPIIKGKVVLRHDGPARLSHWTHAVGVLFLLISGIVLGLEFTPSFVADNAGSEFWFNVHFLFVLPFLFGTFYYLGNSIISRYRLREHLPTRNAVRYTLQHYAHMLGRKDTPLPPEEKYFESERAAFLLAVAASVFCLATGLVKVSAHVFDLPDAFMGVVAWTHDIAAVAMAVFFVMHVLMGAVVPWSWPLLVSMITGKLPLENVEQEHTGWIGQVRERTRQYAEERYGEARQGLDGVDEDECASAPVAFREIEQGKGL